MGMWRGRMLKTGCQSVGSWRLRGAGVGAGTRRQSNQPVQAWEKGRYKLFDLIDIKIYLTIFNT